MNILVKSGEATTVTTDMQEGRLVRLSGKFTRFSDVSQLPAQFFV